MKKAPVISFLALISLAVVNLLLVGCNLKMELHEGLAVDASFSVQQGSHTNTQSIDLVFSASNATGLFVASSQSACESSTDWEPYVTEKAHTLEERNSSHELFAKFRYSDGSVSECLSIQIQHDDFKPLAPVHFNVNTFGNTVTSSSLRFSWELSPSALLQAIVYEVEIRNSADDTVLLSFQEVSDSRFTSSDPGTLPIVGLFYPVLRATDQAGNSSPEVRGPSLSSTAVQIGIILDSYNSRSSDNHIVVDLDGDGDKDVVSVSSDGIVFYKNQGLRNFEEFKVTNLPTYDHIAILDIDGDGDKDVLAASDRGNSVYLLENDGEENFSEGLLFEVTAYIGGINVIDVENDGVPEIAVPSSFSFADSQIFHLTSSGQWEERNSLDITAKGKLFFADFDGDGLSDIIGGSQLTRVHYFANDGSGEFLPGTEITNSNALYNLGFDLADIDKDGDLDFVSATDDYFFCDYGLAWFENDGSGVFTRRILILRNDRARLKAVKLADVDGDSELDILYFSLTDGLVWLENNGSESFTTHVIDSSVYSSGGSSLGKISVEDIDQDGANDVILSWGLESMTIYYNDGSGNFTTDKPNGPKSPVLGGSVRSDLGDFNGDGNIDIVSFGQRSVYIYYGDGQGNWGAHLVKAFPDHIYYSKEAIKAADVDGDGLIDFITQDGEREFRLFLNDGLGGFVESLIGIGTFFGGGGVINIEVVDVDGDSDMDIIGVVGSSGGSRAELYQFRNNGSEVFSRQNIASYNTVSEMFMAYGAGQLDNDTDVDFVLYQRNGTVSWFSNNGSGGYSRTNIDLTAPLDARGSQIELGDFDSDGDTDFYLLAADDRMIFYENDGSQNFTRTDYMSMSACKGFQLEDLNSDGELDILCIHSDGVDAFLADGLGDFTKLEVINSYGSPFLDINFMLLKGDYDNDGKNEFLSGDGWFKTFL